MPKSNVTSISRARTVALRRRGVQLMWEDEYTTREIAETFHVKINTITMDILTMRRKGIKLERRDFRRKVV